MQNTTQIWLSWFGVAMFLGLACAAAASASSSTIDLRWGGHLKTHGRVSWPERDSYHALVGLEPRYDGSAEARLKTTVYFANRGSFEIHYEHLFQQGDTLRKRSELVQLAPDLQHVSEQTVNDRRRLFDLTATLDEHTDSRWVHRLDRLAVTVSPEWGTVRLGRQAITWGNGRLFNPLDLFNPFAPTDIEREYKIGDDLLLTQLYIKNTDIQLLYVPRRHPDTGEVEWEQSSLAGKLHFMQGMYEFDLLLASHYDDVVLGGGCVGYLGQAVWRADGTLTFLRRDDSSKEVFGALTANLDYSWNWRQKNWYGFLEIYYNSLADGDYTAALTEPAVLKRLERGDMFTIGNMYIGGQLHVELHPLFNVYLTMITNVADPSGVIQPRATWNVTQNFELTLGGNLYYGDEGTEYGGFELPGADYLNTPSHTAYLWGSYYF